MSRESRRLAAAAALAGSLLVPPAAAARPFDHFETGTSELSWIDAYLLAVASGAAYRGRVAELPGDTWAEKLAHGYEPLGLSVLAFVEDLEAGTGAQALVLEGRRIVLVVFCGTEGHEAAAAVRDMWTDAAIWPLEVEGVRLHRGFHQALDSIWEELRSAVLGVRRGGREIWLTGHSQGGALANLAAFRLSREGIAVGGVYTFGAPKVGDAAFVAEFERRLGGRSQQWSTARDPVTRLPEVADRTAYEKLGVTNMVDASGEARLDTELDMPGVANPLAHRIGSYVNYLYRALPRKVRARVPDPPPLCARGTRLVGSHPENRRPLCRSSVWRIRRDRCRARGGEVLAPWCLWQDPGKLRYLARKLKG